jgi:hypothetical protein
MIKRNNKIIARKGLGMTIEKWLKEEKMRLGRFKIYCVNAQKEEPKLLPIKMPRSCSSGQYRTWDESVRKEKLWAAA